MQYCDFLAWRKDDFIVDRILLDVSFIDDALAKANILNSLAAVNLWGAVCVKIDHKI